MHLRPIRPEDADGIVGLMERSSDQTRYYRFFGPMKRLSEKDLHRFTHVDHVDRVAFVVLLGDQLIAVGRFDRYPGTDDAEVAFLVEDAHQGRGLGSVLLEHLAAAARERGIKRFVAEVLAQNSKMVRVFQDAGYAVRALLRGRRRPPDLPDRARPRTPSPSPTSASSAASPGPSRGCSPRVGRRGRRQQRRGQDRQRAAAEPARVRLRRARSTRSTPARGTSAGCPAYADIESIPDDVDLAVLAVPADEVAGVVEACRRKRVRGLVVVSGGFGETGPEGAPPSGSWWPRPARPGCGWSVPTASGS